MFYNQPPEANNEGDYFYYRFNEVKIEGTKVTVGLDLLWAIAEDSRHEYLSGGGFVIEYTKEDGTWAGNILYIWIS